MSEKQTTKERLKDIIDSIEVGIQDIFQSGKYDQYLRTMSRFHRYSVNNQMLIFMQKPDATLVAGFNKWRDQFERNVIKGQKGIQIIAPTPYKKKIEKAKLDPDTKVPLLDPDGNAVMEEKEIQIPMFKPVFVFDVSQTQGKPLPQLAADLTGNVENFEAFMEALHRTSPVPISIAPIADGADGYFSLTDQKIVIREGMSEIQTVSAVVHEIAHAKLHNSQKLFAPENAPTYQEIEIFDIPGLFSNGRITSEDVPTGLYRYDLRGSDDDPGLPVAVEERVIVNHAGTILTAKPLPIPDGGRLMLTEDEGLNFVGGNITAYDFANTHRKDRNTEEVEAESISFAVCAYYGIETGENSFGYLANWSKDKELKELRGSLETINKASSELITDIDRHYATILKERQASVELAEPQTEAFYQMDDRQYLHLQHSSAGTWDYSIYDKATNTLLDGGLLDEPEFTLDQARDAILKWLSDTPEQITEIPMKEAQEILEELHTFAESRVPEALPSVPDTEFPDQRLLLEDMYFFGYTKDDMYPVSKDRASELLALDVPLYMLYTSNEESMVFDQEDIALHEGIFGVTKADWEAAKDTVSAHDPERRFLDRPDDSFLIYQLKLDAPHELSFTPLDRLKEPPSHENYEVVYTGVLEERKEAGMILEDLYRTFNNDRPMDFTGHSLSIGDIVALKQGGKVSCHYCDTIGFKELPVFSAQKQEDRPSVLEQLKSKKPKLSKSIKQKAEKEAVL